MQPLSRYEIIRIIILIILLIFIPKIMLFFIICGILDFRRSKMFDIESWRRYFLRYDYLTWILSPLNLFIDLISYPNKGVFNLKELPQDFQTEISDLIAVATNNPEIINHLNRQMEGKKRGMIFFKWYGKNIENVLTIPFFHQQFKYIKTIGVSIFNKNHETLVHYGPLRMSYRVLYNLTPLHDEKIYIDVAGKRYFWHDNPLLIFDDTLVHQSVNWSDELRYCLFIDIARPSNYPRIIGFFIKVVQIIAVSARHVFYLAWAPLR